MGRGSTEEGDRLGFDAALPAVAAALPEARHAFDRWMAEAGVDDEDRSDLEVVFSELAANAIRAADDPSAMIEARSWCDDEGLVLEIINAGGDPAPASRRWDMADQLRQGGRGLVIVQAFVDSIEVDRSAAGTVIVRCRRKVRTGRPGGGP